MRDVDGFIRFLHIRIRESCLWNALFISVCVYIRVCASLSPEQLDGFDMYSMFMKVSITGRYPTGYEHCNSKNRGPSQVP
jgi:hypothetical protein